MTQVLTFTVEVTKGVGGFFEAVGKQLGPTEEFKETAPQASRYRGRAISYALSELSRMVESPDERAKRHASMTDGNTAAQQSERHLYGPLWKPGHEPDAQHPVLTPMLLWCPACHKRHVDVGEFATKPHHTHACQHCGMVWRPAIIDTVGVQFLPGFRDAVVGVQFLPGVQGDVSPATGAGKCGNCETPGHCNAYGCSK